MSVTKGTRYRAAIVAIAPAVLLAGAAYHPYYPWLPDTAAAATAAASDTTRWGLSHLIYGVAPGFLLLAFLAVRAHLLEAGLGRWSPSAIPLIVVGSTLFTLGVGTEFALLAAADTGGDVEAIWRALEAGWFIPIVMIGAVAFMLGVLGVARAIARSDVLGPGPTRLVVGALLVMAFARFVPVGPVQFHVQGVAAIVAFWPLAYAMGKRREGGPAAQPQPTPAG